MTALYTMVATRVSAISLQARPSDHSRYSVTLNRGEHPQGSSEKSLQACLCKTSQLKSCQEFLVICIFFLSAVTYKVLI